MAKPADWDLMTTEQRREYASHLANSMRGTFIFAQALTIAIEELKKAKYPEHSNIQDMETLGEILFRPFYGVKF